MVGKSKQRAIQIEYLLKTLKDPFGVTCCLSFGANLGNFGASFGQLGAHLRIMKVPKIDKNWTQK